MRAHDDSKLEPPQTEFGAMISGGRSFSTRGGRVWASRVLGMFESASLSGVRPRKQSGERLDEEEVDHRLCYWVEPRAVCSDVESGPR